MFRAILFITIKEAWHDIDGGSNGDRGVQLMLVGMGTVFVFLTLLVFAVSAMSALILKYFPPAPNQINTGLVSSGGVLGRMWRQCALLKSIEVLSTQEKQLGQNRFDHAYRSYHGGIMNESSLGITDVVLRDAPKFTGNAYASHDMLPIAEKLDQVGFWSLESWGGATFDACIRYLGEDPWQRIRASKRSCRPPQQCCCVDKTYWGYRHYADDLVEKFVERAATNGVDVFLIFDAMNDMRNLRTAVKATLATGKHAQGTISYTVSPVHTLQLWLDLGRQIEDMGANSLCIKDMAGLLKPYTAYELVSGLKESLDIPIHMQCHATTGMSTTTYLKAIEAGIDNVDTAISSMSMTYGHSATESLVAMLQDQPRDTGLDIELLEEISAYFRAVRKKYAQFEGSLRGVDSRILVAQVPGGMLTNLEGQLKEQNAVDRLDDVLEEIPKVREDLGMIPLVTPTSQIVGTQAVINVLSGSRYASITRESAGVLRGEYGATPASVNEDLRVRALDGDDLITSRPADHLSQNLPLRPKRYARSPEKKAS